MLRAINRIYELYPNQRAEGAITLDGEDILDGQGSQSAARPHRHGVPEADAVPMSIYDNVAFGIKLYERLPRSELDGRVEDALTRAALWSEVKDKLMPRACRCPAASSSASASPAPWRHGRK